MASPIRPAARALRSCALPRDSAPTKRVFCSAAPPPLPPPPKPSSRAASTVSTPAAQGQRQQPLPIDSLPRYANGSALGILRLGDYIGTLSFAHSGSLLAAASGMDVLGATVVGTITAVGGGTIRDAVILAKRPFWTEEVEYLYLCIATAATTFAVYSASSPPASRQENVVEFIGDTIGVGAFCVIGAMNGVRARVPPAVIVLCGMATATFGGVVRDVLCGRRVRILHSRAEIYATTAAAGAGAYVVARAAGAPTVLRVGAGVGVAAALRTWAWVNGVRLPIWPDRGEHPARQ